MRRLLHSSAVVLFFFILSCEPSGQGIPGDVPPVPPVEDVLPEDCPDGFRDNEGNCLPTCSDGQCDEGYWCHFESGYCLPNWLTPDENTSSENETTDSPQDQPDNDSSDNPPNDDSSNPDSQEEPGDNSHHENETPPHSSEDEGCQSFMDCAFGENCEDGECVPVEFEIVDTCEEDSDCGFFMTCQLGVCVGCLDDLQCPNGQCIYGLCVSDDLGPGVSCLETNCPEGEHCDWGTGMCEPTCNSDDDCTEDEFCSFLTQSCEPEFRCEDSSECATAMCVAGLCVGCQDDSECGIGTQCVMGACLPNPLGYNPCDDAQCNPDSESCDPLDGTCYPADGSCQSNADCREEHSCNSLFNVCTGCNQDVDCRPEQRCFLSACVSL